MLMTFPPFYCRELSTIMQEHQICFYESWIDIDLSLKDSIVKSNFAKWKPYSFTVYMPHLSQFLFIMTFKLYFCKW